MSDETNTGGPAFAMGYDGDHSSVEQKGMNLRDYFAGQAIASVISVCQRDTTEPCETVEDMFAAKAYRVADAMIKARG